jgi:hypothetical protein
MRLAASSSGVSSWISKNQVLGAGAVLGRRGAELVGSEPLKAASKLKGRVAVGRDVNEGGLMRREKGAEVRRCDRAPAIFRGGERPAGAVRGARGEERELVVELLRAGVERRSGLAEGGGIDWADVKVKVKGFK